MQLASAPRAKGPEPQCRLPAPVRVDLPTFSWHQAVPTSPAGFSPAVESVVGGLRGRVSLRRGGGGGERERERERETESTERAACPPARWGVLRGTKRSKRRGSKRSKCMLRLCGHRSLHPPCYCPGHPCVLTRVVLLAHRSPQMYRCVPLPCHLHLHLPPATCTCHLPPAPATCTCAGACAGACAGTGACGLCGLWPVTCGPWPVCLHVLVCRSLPEAPKSNAKDHHVRCWMCVLGA